MIDQQERLDSLKERNDGDQYEPEAAREEEEKARKNA